jgi:hypothetical protein
MQSEIITATVESVKDKSASESLLLSWVITLIRWKVVIADVSCCRRKSRMTEVNMRIPWT